MLECPKCGRAVDDGAFICPGCDYILDSSFLGDDITDDNRGKSKPEKPKRDKLVASATDGGAIAFGEDAMILGNPREQDWSDFGSRDAGVQREVTQARFYIGGATAQLLHPDAVPEIVPNVFQGSIRLTPFERHVLDFMNGKRSIGRIHKKSGMDDSEFKTSVAMLADKGVIRLRTTKKKKRTASSGMSQSGLSTAGSPPARHLVEPGDRTVIAPQPDGADSGKRSSGNRSDKPKSAIEQLAARDDETDLLMKRRDAKGTSDATELRSEAPKKRDSKDRPANNVPFRSLRSEAARLAQADEDAPSAGKKKGDGWGSDDNPANISNVFARAKAQSKPGGAPSGAAAGKFTPPPDDEQTGMPSQESFPPGVPPEDDDDLLFSPGSMEPSEDAETGAGVAGASQASARGRATGGDPDETGGVDDDDVQQVDSQDIAAVTGDWPESEGDAPTGPERPMHTSNTSLRQPRGGPSSIPEGLRDPTGIGEAASSSPPGAGEGAPAGADEDAIFDEETGTRELASLPTGPLPGEAGRDDGDDDDASRADDADESRGDRDDDEGDDDESDGFIAEQRTAALEPGISKQATASLPAQPMELPSDALQPLPSQRMRVPPHLMGGASGGPSGGAPAVTPPMVPSIPGQSLVTPGAPGSAPAFLRPPGTSAGAVMGLPGGGATRPPTLAKPIAPRPSAQSTVGFEQARKAEKIFEQAMKDHAEGRTSSARMNAKLASQFDPSVPAYKEFLDSLDASAPKPGSVKPRELVLFEEASNAEGRGDYERAATLLQQAIDINGKAAALYNRLGVVLSIRLKRHDEALAHLKRAIELEPGSLVYMNNFSKVTAMLESALEKDPEARKGKKDGKQEKVAIKKMRPKMF